MTMELLLSQDKKALVDDKDYTWLNQWKWTYSKHHNRDGYAIRNNKGKIISLHRFIMQAQPGQQVDHINGNKLDNTRENLRFCTNSQNHANSKLRTDSSSGYKGVWWSKYHNSWRAELTANQKKYHLGSFKTKEEAAKAYKAAAKLYFGEFARA